jgi:GxxExxY protein
MRGFFEPIKTAKSTSPQMAIRSMFTPSCLSNLSHEDTKGTKEHELLMLRIHSPLSDDLEQLAHDVIGGCVEVHRALGPGLLEAIYARAVAIEMTARAIPFEAERSFPVRYRGVLLCQQRLDILVANQIVVEVKSVERLDSIHVAQVLSYLHVADVRLGLLINFNESILKNGIRRVIL